MSFVEIVLIAITLGVDAFSIAVVGGVCFKEIQLKQRLSLILHFGLLQLAMFLLGGCIGNTVLHYIQAVDHWVILLLLGFIGGKLIYDAYHEENEDKLQEEFFSGHRGHRAEIHINSALYQKLKIGRAHV